MFWNWLRVVYFALEIFMIFGLSYLVWAEVTRNAAKSVKDNATRRTIPNLKRLRLGYAKQGYYGLTLVFHMISLICILVESELDCNVVVKFTVPVAALAFELSYIFFHYKVLLTRLTITRCSIEEAILNCTYLTTVPLVIAGPILSTGLMLEGRCTAKLPAVVMLSFAAITTVVSMTYLYLFTVNLYAHMRTTIKSESPRVRQALIRNIIIGLVTTGLNAVVLIYSGTSAARQHLSPLPILAAILYLGSWSMYYTTSRHTDTHFLVSRAIPEIELTSFSKRHSTGTVSVILGASRAANRDRDPTLDLKLPPLEIQDSEHQLIAIIASDPTPVAPALNTGSSGSGSFFVS